MSNILPCFSVVFFFMMICQNSEIIHPGPLRGCDAGSTGCPHGYSDSAIRIYFEKTIFPAADVPSPVSSRYR
jgi:hypothetical protein